MEISLSSPRADFAAVPSTPRPTPTPPRFAFSQVLAEGLVRGAQAAVQTLPGAPIVAAALRGPASPPLGGLGGVGPIGGHALAAPEGPSPIGALDGGVGSLDASLAQSQDMNMAYLRIQEAVNAQDRSFTTLSNVLKAQHDTVKAAIGNIR
jgi:hypothetical protein